ncbi:MAG: hypothetical protein J6Y92_01365 [Lentisphaeria bacterium]|nr:hypothetical protein [Lentisphaeria bacterium]
MSVEVIRKIDSSKDQINWQAFDLIGYSSKDYCHQHTLWGRTVSVPSEEDFLALAKETKRETRKVFEDMRELCRETESKCHREVDGGLMEIEAQFNRKLEELARNVEKGLSEGSPFFGKFSRQLNQHLALLQKLSTDLSAKKAEIEKLISGTAEQSKALSAKLDQAESQMNALQRNAAGCYEKQLKLAEEMTAKQKQAEERIQSARQKTEAEYAKRKQEFLNEISERQKQAETECSNLIDRYDIMLADYKQLLQKSFWGRLKWLFTGKI